MHSPPARAFAATTTANPYSTRSLITWNATGTPIFEAMQASGIPLDAFLQLEDNLHTRDCPREITSTTEFLTMLPQHSGGSFRRQSRDYSSHGWPRTKGFAVSRFIEIPPFV